MRRIALPIACLLCLPFVSGCILPYCAYPKIDYTPPVSLDAKSSEVHAFRVDITRPTADLGVFVSPVYERLSEIPVTNTDEVPTQVKPSVSYGFVVIGIALNYLTHTSRSLAVRLYRPGFELVEIKSWERVHRVAWKPSADLEAQEKALEALFRVGRLESGSTAARHKDALLFGAAEYDRLAATASSPGQRERLVENATKLRDLASK